MFILVNMQGYGPHRRGIFVLPPTSNLFFSTPVLNLLRLFMLNKGKQKSTTIQCNCLYLF
ncbi:hypothetical protein C7N43_15710 [Sphingobacteriales bacterium UPWRP_1]|nr:hypothetical protein BVG80_04355 [Sphingobacteriales bacterium TSM_CSM]PSJ76054.1 hypothetical protein C7N43_15710 [Sphingobacteriales bacterium UPWRP_1]